MFIQAACSSSGCQIELPVGIVACFVTGTAAMLAHMLKNDAKAAEILGDVRFQAVGIATPAVLTQELADSCREYITSVVLMVRLTLSGP